ncbi:cobalamin B12-binding domain-containing protein [Sphaerisporangium rubeum]|uniref:Methylmalonyl-CoA mutase cobalamin-binding subunit n=1 Tax=Sphaerisporangium rubeum TaxID=321317 RepID=A0A7X0IKM7_9ACTN|nr:cobalamin-dependent protein [Sphaerisporangium rubeum]MBB6476725.1 methylmalonyl-CoA mutase cobalamin-binding subunit [Sphaerisporangium rubeum]
MAHDRSPHSGGPRALVSGLECDSHTWNLVYIELVLRELGHEVVNLGACVPDGLVVRECRRHRPGLVVIGTVNGHGLASGVRLARRLRGSPGLATVPLVIGGKLTTSGTGGPRVTGPLLAAGYSAVFPEDTGIGAFRSYVETLAAGAAHAERAVR